MAVDSIETLKELSKLQRSHNVTVVDFYATWCGPCMMIKKPYATLATKYRDCAFVQCNVEEAEELAAKFRISSLPTFIVFSGENKVRCIQGADLEAVESALKPLVTKASAAAVGSSGTKSKKSDEDRHKAASQKTTKTAKKEVVKSHKKGKK